MSRLYNPQLVPKDEIKQTFVGRHKLIAEITSIIKNQPVGAGVQHLIIVAPRGMGKTTLLLMLRYAIEDSNLAKKFQPIQFPEESYDIYELSDFWIKIAECLAEDTDDENLRTKIEEIKSQFTKNKDLHDAAYSLLKGWKKKTRKSLVLLIDNFDMILQQINSEQDAARLRKVLMNEDTVMLIGSAVTFFQEVRGYEHPLYNFFKIYNLEGFNTETIEKFLSVRAKSENVKDFGKFAKEHGARIKTLAYFTDGNPRLVLMLYDIIANSKIADVEKSLEKLLDEITPYLKSKIELLPAQQRKILDYIARMSFQKREGVTPGEISEQVRLKPNQTSSQLKRLAEDGYIRAANVSGRSSFYVLSEPLLVIWYQMRFGRTAFQKRRWLIYVLKGLYELKELRKEHKRLNRPYQKALASGETQKAKDILRHRYYLAEAMPEFSGAASHFEHFVTQSLTLKDESALKEECKNPNLLKKLTDDSLDKLLDQGFINKTQYTNAKSASRKYKLGKSEKKSNDELLAGQMILKQLQPTTRQKQIEKALKHLNKSVKLNSKNLRAIQARASILFSQSRFTETISDLNEVIKIHRILIDNQTHKDLEVGLAMAHIKKGVALDRQDKYDDAISQFKNAIEICTRLMKTHETTHVKNLLAAAYLNQGVSLNNQRDFETAISKNNKSIEILEDLVSEHGDRDSQKGLAIAYGNKGNALRSKGQFDKAISQIDNALEILENLVNDKGDNDVLHELAMIYMNKSTVLRMKREFDKATTQSDKAIEILEDLVNNNADNNVQSDLARAYMNNGVALKNQGEFLKAVSQYDKALNSFGKVIELNQGWKTGRNRARVLLSRAAALIKMDDISGARLSLLDAVNSLETLGDNSFSSGIFNLILSVAKVDDYSDIRRLLDGEEMENRFFPVLRAIDFLETKDRDLLEKLSPEVRGVVEKTIEFLTSGREDGNELEPTK